jgi:hypothetical protein
MVMVIFNRITLVHLPLSCWFFISASPVQHQHNEKVQQHLQKTAFNSGGADLIRKNYRTVSAIKTARTTADA